MHPREDLICYQSSASYANKMKTKLINTAKNEEKSLVQYETVNAGQLVLAIGEDNVVLLHIRGIDLVASEARYHSTCQMLTSQGVIHPAAMPP